MKKMNILMALMLGLSLMVSGCGTTTDDTENAGETAAATEAASEGSSEAESEAETEKITRGEYNVSDYVTVKDYMNLKISKDDIEPTDDELQTSIDSFLSGLATTEEVTDRAVEDGDTVNIDYKGFLGDEQFQGGTAEGSDLTIGSNTFIDGFEEGLIGAKIGDTVSLDLTFPDPYPNNTDLSGAEVRFDVTVNSITATITPEYTDELVAENTEDYKTVEEYNTYLKDQIRQDNKDTEFAKAFYNCAEFTGEIPQSLLDYYYDVCYSTIASYYGEDTIQSYMTQYGLDKNGFVDNMYGSTYVTNEAQIEMLLLAIAENENIQAEGEEYEASLAEQAESAGMTTEELIENYGEEEVKIAYRKNAAYMKVYDSMILE